MFRKDSQTILAHFSKAAAYFDLLWLCAFLGKDLNRAVDMKGAWPSNTPN